MCTNVVIWIQEFTEYTNFEKCLEYLEDRMIKLGPFDGLIGFSQVSYLHLKLHQQSLICVLSLKTLNLILQGAILSGGLPGLQAKVRQY